MTALNLLTAALALTLFAEVAYIVWRSGGDERNW